MVPTKWPLGRVVDTHPGQDEFVRVVTVQPFRRGLYKDRTHMLPKRAHVPMVKVYLNKTVKRASAPELRGPCQNG